MTLKPRSGRESDTKPSAAISSTKPKCSFRKAADAAGSSTLSETAEPVIFKSAGPAQGTGRHLQAGGQAHGHAFVAREQRVTAVAQPLGPLFDLRRCVHRKARAREPFLVTCSLPQARRA